MNPRVLTAAWMLTATAAMATSDNGHKMRLIATFVVGTDIGEREKAADDAGLTMAEDLGELSVSILEAPGDVSIMEEERVRRNPKILVVEEDVFRRWLYDEPQQKASASFDAADATLRALATVAPHRRPAPQSGVVPWGVARVDAPASWHGGAGRGVKVAVVDTGIDCSHPDLDCDFSRGRNFVDPGMVPFDDNSHGTHVAGTIAGRGADGGLLGVAPQATLMPVKALNSEGAGNLSDIVKGIQWAAENGAAVINLSLGAPIGSAALERAVQFAQSRGAVVVAAAGNAGPMENSVGFPAAYAGVIAVAAFDRRDRVADFSSRGREIAFAAPGVDVISTIPGGRYRSLSGTSMASPHVAGLAVLAVERGATGSTAVRTALRDASNKLCRDGRCAPLNEEGAGVVDAARLR